MATAKRTRTKASSKSAPVSRKADADVAKITTQAVDVQDAIRARAYELFQQRGGQHGYDFEDWIRAEREVKKRFGIAAAA